MRLMNVVTGPRGPDTSWLGVLLSGDYVGDLRGGHARFLSEVEVDPGESTVGRTSFPTSVAELLRDGSVDAVRATYEWMSKLVKDDPSACDSDGRPLFVPLADCQLLAPLSPSKLIAVGRNYLSHLEEADTTLDHRVPSAWIKANNTICGPGDDIVKPKATQELDYETELSLVIGRRCKDVLESRAYEVLAGYTIVNDVSARDVARTERKEGNQLLGKMFDTFAPMGPWLVTADEIPDPMNLRLLTRVNGEVRQDSNTNTMIWPIPKLIAYISQMTLEPGDVITTGTPDGCAMGHEGENWFLKPGDILESELEGIGVITNPVVDEPDKKASWRW